MQENRAYILLENLSRAKKNDVAYKKQRAKSLAQVFKTQNVIYLGEACSEKRLLKPLSHLIEKGLNEFVFYFDDTFSTADVRNVIPQALSFCKAKFLDVDFHYACISFRNIDRLKIKP